MLKALMCLVLFAAISGCAYPDHASTNTSAPSSHPGGNQTDALIFNGASIWEAEVDSIETLLYEHGATYQQVDSKQLDAMSLDDLSKFKLLIIPGGDAPTITESLSHETHERLREAIQRRGVNYLGFCAGAWLAVAPAPAPGKDVEYGIGFVNGPIQQPNYLQKEGKEFAISRASFPNGSQRDLLWYGGPITPQLPDGVIAKYPDGTPAITQIWSGKGFVIVSGLHPTATPPILNALGLEDRQAIAPDFAWELLDAGIHQKPLPAF